METTTQHHWRLILEHAGHLGELYGFSLLLQGGAIPTNGDGSMQAIRNDSISLKNRVERFHDIKGIHQTGSYLLSEVMDIYFLSLEKTISKFGSSTEGKTEKWRVTLNWGVVVEDGDYCTTLDATSSDHARFLCAAEMAQSMDIEDYREIAEFIVFRLASSERCEVVTSANRVTADLREFLEDKIPAGAVIDLDVIAHAITEHHRLVTTGSRENG